MQTRTPRTPRTFRLNEAEFAAIRKAAADVGLPWNTFVRRVALTATKGQLRPATIEVDGEAIALTEVTAG